MKKADIIAGGLDGLLSAPSPAPTPAPAETTTTKAKASAARPVCYNIPGEIAERVKAIARFDRVPISAVVTAALSRYIESWKPTNEKPPQVWDEQKAR